MRTYVLFAKFSRRIALFVILGHRPGHHDTSTDPKARRGLCCLLGDIVGRNELCSVLGIPGGLQIFDASLVN